MPTVSFTEKAHLLSAYSSFAWPSASAGPSVAALGSETGSITVWDLRRGEVKNKLSGSSSSSKSSDKGKKASVSGHTSAVSGLVWADEGSTLYSSSASSANVIQWDAAKGEAVRSFPADKRSVSRLAASSDGSTLFAAGANIAVVEASSGKRQRVLQGHSLPVTGMVVSADDTVLVSCSDERNIHLWDLQSAAEDAEGEDGAGAPEAPTVVLLHPSRPLPNSLSIVRIKKGTYHISAVAEDGTAQIWRYKRSKGEKSSKPLSVGCTIRLRTDSSKTRTALHAEKRGILAVQLVSRDSGAVAVVAAGTLAVPSFYQAPYTEDDGSHLQAVVELDAARTGAAAANGSAAAAMDDSDEEGGSKARSEAAQLQATDGTAVIAETRGAIAARASASADDAAAAAADAVAKAPGSRKRKRSESEDGAGAGSKSSSASAAVEVDGELTLGERLSAVVAALRNPAATDLRSALAGGTTTGEGSSGVAGGAGAGASGGTSVASHILTTGSLAVVLQQALQANDDAQLELVLAHTDKAVIANTIARLPTTYVLPFLTKVVARFQSTPSRGLQLVHWIRALLSSHTGYLLTVPHLIASLETLYTIIDSRLAVYKKMVKLSGRLDLLMAQIGAGGAGMPSGRTLKRAKLAVTQAQLDAQGAMRGSGRAGGEEVEDEDEDEEEADEDEDEDEDEEDDDGDEDEDDDEDDDEGEEDEDDE